MLACKIEFLFLAVAALVVAGVAAVVFQATRSGVFHRRRMTYKRSFEEAFDANDSQEEHKRICRYTPGDPGGSVKDALAHLAEVEAAVDCLAAAVLIVDTDRCAARLRSSINRATDYDGLLQTDRRAAAMKSLETLHGYLDFVFNADDSVSPAAFYNELVAIIEKNKMSFAEALNSSKRRIISVTNEGDRMHRMISVHKEATKHNAYLYNSIKHITPQLVEGAANAAERIGAYVRGVLRSISSETSRNSPFASMRALSKFVMDNRSNLEDGDKSTAAAACTNCACKKATSALGEHCAELKKAMACAMQKMGRCQEFFYKVLISKEEITDAIVMNDHVMSCMERKLADAVQTVAERCGVYPSEAKRWNMDEISRDWDWTGVFTFPESSALHCDGRVVLSTAQWRPSSTLRLVSQKAIRGHAISACPYRRDSVPFCSDEASLGKPDGVLTGVWRASLVVANDHDDTIVDGLKIYERLCAGIDPNVPFVGDAFPRACVVQEIETHLFLVVTLHPRGEDVLPVAFLASDAGHCTALQERTSIWDHAFMPRTVFDTHRRVYERLAEHHPGVVESLAFESLSLVPCARTLAIGSTDCVQMTDSEADKHRRHGELVGGALPSLRILCGLADRKESGTRENILYNRMVLHLERFPSTDIFLLKPVEGSVRCHYGGGHRSLPALQADELDSQVGTYLTPEEMSKYDNLFVSTVLSRNAGVVCSAADSSHNREIYACGYTGGLFCSPLSSLMLKDVVEFLVTLLDSALVNGDDPMRIIGRLPVNFAGALHLSSRSANRLPGRVNGMDSLRRYTDAIWFRFDIFTLEHECLRNENGLFPASDRLLTVADVHASRSNADQTLLQTAVQCAHDRFRLLGACNAKAPVPVFEKMVTQLIDGGLLSEQSLELCIHLSDVVVNARGVSFPTVCQTAAKRVQKVGKQMPIQHIACRNVCDSATYGEFFVATCDMYDNDSMNIYEDLIDAVFKEPIILRQDEFPAKRLRRGLSASVIRAQVTAFIEVCREKLASHDVVDLEDRADLTIAFNSDHLDKVVFLTIPEGVVFLGCALPESTMYSHGHGVLRHVLDNFIGALNQLVEAEVEQGIRRADGFHYFNGLRFTYSQYLTVVALVNRARSLGLRTPLSKRAIRLVFPYTSQDGLCIALNNGYFKEKWFVTKMVERFNRLNWSQKIAQADRFFDTELEGIVESHVRGMGPDFPINELRSALDIYFSGGAKCIDLSYEIFNSEFSKTATSSIVFREQADHDDVVVDDAEDVSVVTVYFSFPANHRGKKRAKRDILAALNALPEKAELYRFVTGADVYSMGHMVVEIEKRPRLKAPRKLPSAATCARTMTIFDYWFSAEGDNSSKKWIRKALRNDFKRCVELSQATFDYI